MNKWNLIRKKKLSKASGLKSKKITLTDLYRQEITETRIFVSSLMRSMRVASGSRLSSDTDLRQKQSQF